VKQRRYWGAGRLKDGVLVELGGFKVSPEKDGILRIDVPRSDHNGIEVWRFKNQIVKPMSWEFAYLEREEVKAARKDRRPVKIIPYPEAGIWSRKTYEIEYPGYSEKTLEKIKEMHSKV
jgi:hypothetical protein